MNIEAEFAEADRRVRARIERNAKDAVARIEAATEGELRDGSRKSPLVEAFEAWGVLVRQVTDGFAAFAAAYRSGGVS